MLARRIPSSSSTHNQALVERRSPPQYFLWDGIHMWRRRQYDFKLKIHLEGVELKVSDFFLIQDFKLRIDRMSCEYFRDQVQLQRILRYARVGKKLSWGCGLRSADGSGRGGRALGARPVIGITIAPDATLQSLNVEVLCNRPSMRVWVGHLPTSGWADWVTGA